MSDTTDYPTAPLVKLEEVEWRLDSEAYQRGGGREYVARWVPYLDATKVARLMDDWVGPARWRIDRYWVPEWTTSGLMCQVTSRSPSRLGNGVSSRKCSMLARRRCTRWRARRLRCGPASV